MAIIEVNHVVKEFRLGQLQNARLAAARAMARISGRPVPQRPRLTALDDVHFSVQRGEVVGIIGHNGAGKSTLLKLLSRITVPTRGSVKVHGRVAPLIEVGAGLVGELTARENIYLNATILGMPRKEIARKFDEIVAFAELEAFLDTPIKRCSSGMAVRLGFSIASSVQAPILIVDEVLAVGDIAFQRKCLDRMEGIIESGEHTLIVVGHNIRQLERICSRILWLDHGKLIMDGDPGSVCRAFFESAERKIAAQTDRKKHAIRPSHDVGAVSVVGIEVLGAYESPDGLVVPLHGAVRIRITVQAHRRIVRPEIIIGAHTPDLVYVFAMSSALGPGRPDFSKGLMTIECAIPDLPLRPGQYGLRIGILDHARHVLWYGENLCPFRSVPGSVDVTRIPELGLTHLKCDWSFSEVEPNVADPDSEVALPRSW